MKRLSVFLVLAILAPLSGFASGTVQDEIAALGKSGKVAFILVFDQTPVQVDSARQIISEAVKKAPGTVKIELNRDDAANADFVKKYRLLGAPVPLILVMSPTGIITGGRVAAGMTADMLVGMVPSPKKTAVVQALSEGKAVFMTFSHKGMKTAQSVNTACGMACQQMAGKSVQVTIDMADPKEARFVEEMRVNKAATEPVTIVANAQGQIAGTYNGGVQVTDLIASATKRIGGCCPKSVSNPNASCGPQK